MGCCLSKDAAVPSPPPPPPSQEETISPKHASPPQNKKINHASNIATVQVDPAADAVPCKAFTEASTVAPSEVTMEAPQTAPPGPPSCPPLQNTAAPEPVCLSSVNGLPFAEKLLTSDGGDMPCADKQVRKTGDSHPRFSRVSPRKAASPAKVTQKAPSSPAPRAKLSIAKPEDTVADEVREEEIAEDHEAEDEGGEGRAAQEADEEEEEEEHEARGRGRGKFPSSARKEWLSRASAGMSTNKLNASRTNSFSRDPSPVDHGRAAKAAARPASPLKRSPSIHHDPPRLTRTSSGKSSSPCRGVAPSVSIADAEPAMKPRPLLHRHSSSKETFPDPPSHKRTSSRESATDFPLSSEARKPSPPKRAPHGVPSSDPSRLLNNNKRPAAANSTPSKENRRNASNIDPPSASSSTRGRSPMQRQAGIIAQEHDSNRNGRRKEKSPLRRTGNFSQCSIRLTDRNADLSINSDTLSVFHAEHAASMGKDTGGRTRRAGSRVPLREITDNSSRNESSKQGLKQGSDVTHKGRDEVPYKHQSSVKPKDEVLQQEETIKSCAVSMEQDPKSMVQEFVKHNDYALESKAESLVLEGKSVLGAFKALEEYRMKLANRNTEACKDRSEEVGWDAKQVGDYSKESLSQPMQLIRGWEEKSQQAPELQRSRSTKKSCEPFLFPDVQSLLLSENEGMQFEGGLTMPASVSKACSILRAVADLNMGTSVFPKKREHEDEIEHPNLLSFQFGDGVNTG